MKGIKEEVYVPEADDAEILQKNDPSREDEGKFDDESSDEDDEAANQKDKQKKTKLK